MMWEAVTAIGTVFTGLVILFTVLMAAHQVRAANEQVRGQTEQLAQLRRATQLQGTMRIFGQLQAPEIRKCIYFVIDQFAERMTDEKFREEAGRPRRKDFEVHQETVVLSFFEEVGTYIKFGLLDPDVIYDYAGPIVQATWERLSGIIALQRAAYGGPELWENYEYLYNGSKRYGELTFGSGKH